MAIGIRRWLVKRTKAEKVVSVISDYYVPTSSSNFQRKPKACSMWAFILKLNKPQTKNDLRD